jgi:hypothetical protein
MSLAPVWLNPNDLSAGLVASRKAMFGDRDSVVGRTVVNHNYLAAGEMEIQKAKDPRQTFT